MVSVDSLVHSEEPQFPHYIQSKQYGSFCFYNTKKYLATSLGTVGGVVLRWYMYGVYPWNVLSGCGLYDFIFICHPGEYWYFYSYFL